MILQHDATARPLQQRLRPLLLPVRSLHGQRVLARTIRRRDDVKRQFHARRAGRRPGQIERRTSAAEMSTLWGSRLKMSI